MPVASYEFNVRYTKTTLEWVIEKLLKYCNSRTYKGTIY